jgi:hypothetical protein
MVLLLNSVVIEPAQGVLRHDPITLGSNLRVVCRCLSLFSEPGRGCASSYSPLDASPAVPWGRVDFFNFLVPREADDESKFERVLGVQICNRFLAPPRGSGAPT